MRTWIIFGAMTVCYAINPELEYSNTIASWLVALVLAGIIMDGAEFFIKILRSLPE